MQIVQQSSCNFQIISFDSFNNKKDHELCYFSSNISKM